MAADERSQSSCLGLLQQQGEEFNFFQAIRLLEKVAIPDQKIRYKAINSEAFHPNFIAEIKKDALNNKLTKNHKNNITVSVNGFGLTGQQGPIPQCFSEMFRRATVSGKKGAEDPHAFLDIFNDKQISLLYEIKKHFDPMLFNEAPRESSLYKLLSSICGFNNLNIFDRLPVSSDQLTAFAPIMANRRTDYSLLYNILKTYFNCDVKITPNQGAWRPLPLCYQGQCYQAQLKTNNQQTSRSTLGKGMGLGKKYWDNQAAISIDINVPDIKTCLNLLPGGEEYKMFKGLISFLTDAKYMIYVKLLINWKDIPKSKLNPDTQLKLGQSSWLNSHQTVTARVNHPQFVIYPSIEHQFATDKAEAAA